MSKEEALETLTSLKAEFDAAVKDAQEDGRRWKLLRHYTDPKGREDEFAGYAQQAVTVAELVTKDDKPAATAQLQGMKTAFDAVSADYRAAPMDFLESCFGIYAQEAYRFERFSQACEKLMKLI
ncbi:MAG: hypothetical protein ACAH83_05595 [Alphaproteobacteria bacterium]